METVLRDMGVYKNRLLTSILDSDDIKDILLIGEEYSDELWYGKDDDENDYGIVYKQVFPTLYIDDTQTTVLSYICFDVDILRIQNDSIKDMKIIIWCLCHKSCMKYSKKKYLGTRADILADAVERALRNSEAYSIEHGKAEFGIGRLHLDSVTYINSEHKEYYGKQMIFTTPDFRIKSIR